MIYLNSTRIFYLWSCKLSLASNDIFTVSECWLLLVIKLFPQKCKKKKTDKRGKKLFFKKGGGGLVGKDGAK